MYVTNPFRKRELETEEAGEKRKKQESTAKKQRRIRQNSIAQGIEEVSQVFMSATKDLTTSVPVILI